MRSCPCSMREIVMGGGAELACEFPLGQTRHVSQVAQLVT